MEQKLTIPEITFMRALAGIKTDKELAKLLDKPVELITLQFSIMAGLPKRPDEKPPIIAKLLSSEVINDQPVEQKQPKKRGPKKKEKAEKTPKKKLQSMHAQEEERKKIRKVRRNQSIYSLRPLNLAGLVPYKLNAKTTVYDKPGADVGMLKQKYNIA